MTELTEPEAALAAFGCALFGAAILAVLIDVVWP